MAPRRVSTRFTFGLLSVTVGAGLWLTAAPRADQQVAVKSIQVPSVAVPRVTVPTVAVPVTTPLPGQSVTPTVLMVTDRGLSSNQSDASARDEARHWDQTPEYGPPNGTRFIAGGSTEGLPITLRDKFIELGGGVDGTFVIVPTAGGNFDGTGDDKKVRVYVESQVISPWLTRGLKNVKMLHTHDPKIADTVEFAKVLSDATAVWFGGGRQWNIVDSYAGTHTTRNSTRCSSAAGSSAAARRARRFRASTSCAGIPAERTS